MKINGIEINENDPIVFLDVDGVLTYDICRAKVLRFERKHENEQPKLTNLENTRLEARFFDKGCINNLEKIVFSSNAWIVISSDRQGHLSVEDLRFIFKDYKFADRIIDKTLEGEISMKRECHGPSILNWLKRYPAIKHWIALDDLNLEADLGENFVHCAKEENYYCLGCNNVLKEALEKLHVTQTTMQVNDYTHLEENAYKDLGKLYEFFMSIKKGEIEKIRNFYPKEFHYLRFESQTPLHFAAAAHQAELVDYFLEQGLSVNSKDINSRTPLDYFLKAVPNLNVQGELDDQKILEKLILADAELDQSDYGNKRTFDHVDKKYRTKLQEIIECCRQQKTIACYDSPLKKSSSSAIEQANSNNNAISVEIQPFAQQL